MAGIAAALLSAINKTSPGLEQKLAWGFPSWRGNEYIFSIIAHRAHCNLQLWSGARLAVAFPARIEGTGKAIRHVKVRALADIDDELLAIIARAIELDQTAPKRVP